MTGEPRQATEPAAKAQSSDQFVTGRLRLSGGLIMTGILVQGLTLVWNHPLSFLAFLGIGSLEVFAGIVVYLLALVSPRRS